MGLCSARLAANRETRYHDRHPLVCVSTLPLRNNRLRRRAEADHAVICSSAAASHVAGGVGTPPTSQESAASLALVPNKCACREWPLCESAQVVEWPRHLCWCFRQCRSPKMCVMVARCATHSRPLGWRAHTYLWVPAGLVPHAAHHQQAWMSLLCLRAGAAAPPQQHTKGLQRSRPLSHLNSERQQKLGLEGT